MIERGRVPRFIPKVLEPIFRRAPDMENRPLVSRRSRESTVFKTMQRTNAPAGRAPWIVLEQTGAGFRVSAQT